MESRNLRITGFKLFGVAFHLLCFAIAVIVGHYLRELALKYHREDKEHPDGP